MRAPLIADINAFRHSRERFSSKGGRGYRSIVCIARDEGQATAEFAVILALIAAVLVFVFSALGTTTAHLFNEVVSQFGQ